MNSNLVFARFDAALVYYEKEQDALYLKFTGNLKNHEEFVEVNFSVLSAFKKLNTTNFVADIRKLGFSSNESQNWVAKVLLPGMINHLKGKTLYHPQLIDPKEVMSKIAATSINLKTVDVIKCLEVEQFTSEDVLKNKLLSMKNSIV